MSLYDEIEYINKFLQLRPGHAYKPRLLDLFNIKEALNAYSPDLIIELGCGASSALFQNMWKVIRQTT